MVPDIPGLFWFTDGRGKLPAMSDEAAYARHSGGSVDTGAVLVHEAQTDMGAAHRLPIACSSL